MSLQFDLPKNNSSIIKVIGVGGGGSNAVNHMFNQGITGVDFVVCNTDSQALDISPVSNKLPLGGNLTEGRGAGSDPEVGKNAAMENVDSIRELLCENTKMVFITAGMGGGTGTGAAPVIAEIAKELGILTVAIVTTPFKFEGKSRWKKAMDGLSTLKKNVDTSLVISNEKLQATYGNLPLSSAFSYADDILATAAKGIAEIITVPGYVNVDFEDVKNVMMDSGKAILGSASGEGSERATDAVSAAVDSPLLSDNDIKGARYILLNITSGTKEILMDEITVITDYIQDKVGDEADVVWGHCHDESIGEKVSVTIIATAFEKTDNNADSAYKQTGQSSNGKTIRHLDESNEQKGKKEEEKEPNPQMSIKFEDESHQERTAVRESDNRDDDNREYKSRNYDLRKNEDIDHLEQTPAYVRRKVRLKDVPHSSETEVSRYTLGNSDEKDDDDDEKKPNIGRNNSFLYDNVD